jgi:hypothetical protein
MGPVPSTGALVKYISLAVVGALVGAGLELTAQTLTIDGAAPGTPIVVQTTAPHCILDTVNGAHAVVSGVDGVTNANGTYVLIPTDPTHLALYSLAPDGTYAGVAGTGTYVSGGTIQRALVGDRILLGRQHIAEQASSPRLIFVPVGSSFKPPGISSATNVSGFPRSDVKYGWLGRPLATDLVRFQVYAWGCATPPDPEGGDFDATKTLYHCVLQQAQLMTSGRWSASAGVWLDQMPTATQLIKLGHAFVFDLEIETPVLDSLLSFLPGGTTGTAIVNLSGAPDSDAVTIAGV